MTTENMNRPYFHGLDLVRFMAALMVVVFHLSRTIYQSDSRGYMITQGQNPASVGPYFSWGHAGVQIFFVISGLVIANSANGSSLFAFVRGRAERLYPAVWICAPISFIIWWINGVTPHEQNIFNLLQSITLYPFGGWIDTPYWTLGHELIFYGCVGLMLLAGQIRHMEKFACLITAIASYNWGGQTIQTFLGIHLPGIGHLDAGTLRLFFPVFGAYFGLGIFLWLHFNARLSRIGKCFAILAVLVAMAPYTLLWHQIGGMTPAGIVWLLGLGAIIAACLFPSALRREQESLMHRILRTLGLATYPLYLIHFALGAYAMHALATWGIPSDMALLIVIPSLVAFAIIIAVWAEPTIRRAIRRIFAVLKEQPSTIGRIMAFLSRPNRSIPASR